MADQAENLDLLSLTAEIVSAHVANNHVAAGELPALIANIHGALSGLGQEAASSPTQELKPAVSIKKSVQPDYIICLEDGAKVKMLKRYLRSRFGMSPGEYRKKWGLPGDYPMVAPEYRERRSALARTIGLGRKKDETSSKPATQDAAPAKRGRRSKTSPLEAAKAFLGGSSSN